MGKSDCIPTYIYVCAAVFRCGKDCKYLRILHLDPGAECAWGVDGKAVGSKQTIIGGRVDRLKGLVWTPAAVGF